jgi:hypothetical protein
MARYSQDSYGQDRYGSTYQPFSASVAATVVATYVRVQSSGALAASATVVIALAREKWEPIAEGEAVWTPIVNDSVTWTEIAA